MSNKEPQFDVTWTMLSCLKYLRDATFNEMLSGTPTRDLDDLLDIWILCTRQLHNPTLTGRHQDN